jgi:NADPH2:quinone reductase
MDKIKTEAIVLVKNGAAAHAFERRVITIAAPKENEVVIDSEAFGLNYADVMARRGIYREAPPLPCVVGYEVVGKVVTIGKNVSPTLLGKRVVAFCRFGGYAQKVVTQDHAVMEIQHTPAETAMALCTQAVTAYYMAAYLAPIRKNEKVLIHAAAGGVGNLLIQLAKRQGAVVFATIGSEHKRDLVLRLGADYCLNYTKVAYEKEIENILQSDRLDASFNPVGGNTLKKDMGLIGSGGRLFLFGGSQLTGAKWGIFSQLNFLRKMGVILPIALMMRSKTILGVNMLKLADNRPEVVTECLRAVVELFHSGELIPQVGGTYPVSEIAAAHEALENGRTTGKLTMFW